MNAMSGAPVAARDLLEETGYEVGELLPIAEGNVGLCRFANTNH
ncbi:MAG: hypothetical protein FD149_421 [Rhodospirillaceae bacterium]|nr:MAG: hypothetical protein FD149_421 [Rhodospirillaceae bacterium]